MATCFDRNKNVRCRLCKKEYKQKEGRYNIFQKLGEGITPNDRLLDFGIVLEKNAIESDSICKNCEGKISKLEHAKYILVNWGFGTILNKDAETVSYTHLTLPTICSL